MYFDVAKQLDLKTSWDILRPPETQAWETAALNWTVSHGVFAERVAHELNLQHIWKTCPVVIRNSKPVQFFCKNNQVWRRVTSTEVFLLAIWRCFALHPGAVHLQRWDHAGVFATTCWRFQQCGAILSIFWSGNWGQMLAGIAETDFFRWVMQTAFASIWHHVWCFAAKDSRSPLSRSAKFNWDQRSGQSIQCTWKKLENTIFLVALATWITGFVELYLWGLQEAETVQQKPSWGWAKVCSWLQWLQCLNLSDALQKNAKYLLGCLCRGALQCFQGRHPWKTTGFRLQERGDWGLRLSALCGYDVTCLSETLRLFKQNQVATYVCVQRFPPECLNLGF